MLGPLRRTGFASYRAMATLSTSNAPPFKPFRLALVQMGGVTSSKEENLAHAKELIARAASPGNGAKPGVIVLPVGSCLSVDSGGAQAMSRNASTRRMERNSFQNTARQSGISLVNHTMLHPPQVEASKCFLRPRKRQECGLLEVCRSE
jgi:hypothetical protein